jgi:hypothetical protein
MCFSEVETARLIISHTNFRIQKVYLGSLLCLLLCTLQLQAQKRTQLWEKNDFMLTDECSTEHELCNLALLKFHPFRESIIAERGNEITKHSVVGRADHCAGNMTVIWYDLLTYLLASSCAVWIVRLLWNTNVNILTEWQKSPLTYSWQRLQ